MSLMPAETASQPKTTFLFVVATNWELNYRITEHEHVGSDLGN